MRKVLPNSKIFNKNAIHTKLRIVSVDCKKCKFFKGFRTNQQQKLKAFFMVLLN